MAPEPADGDEWADPPKDNDAFLEDVRKFYAIRGTTIDTAAKVNGKQIDLFKLFNVVSSRGGYDTVSSQKLEWRKVGQEFGLGPTNGAAYAFALKTVYYKFLAAYALKKVYKQEPPPKEILENISAKGGDLLTRTTENFTPPQTRDLLANGIESDGSGDETNRTPEKMDMDEPGSGGRATRGLRQAPPQRVLFQPDLSSSRQSRNTPSNAQSPQPVATPSGGGYVYNPASNPNSMSFSIANYEPRPQIPLTLRGVITPGNNPALFKERVRRLREAQIAKNNKDAPSYKGMMLPGTGFDGPNIYVRTLLALRSGISEEQDYALHHLVKISHERGDKYKFDAFPGLAEGLIEKALEVSSLYYDVKWEISYVDDCSTRGANVLDGMNGTPNILERIRGLQVLDIQDDLNTKEFNHKLLKMNEVCLVIRNMSMLEDNAKYLSEQQQLCDFLTIALNLPRLDCVIEIKHYALDIAEQLTKYWSLDSSHPLYSSLLDVLEEGQDRGAALTTLRAISRISMNLEESNRLNDIPISIIIRLSDWILLDDDELVASCLDFFYQYTAVPDNVAFLLANSCDSESHFSLPPFLVQLGRLLLHNHQESFSKRLVTPAKPPKATTEIPSLPSDMVDLIRTYAEPDRSSHWLRACFEEDSDSNITQIALWQAYQMQCTQYATPATPLLAAAEFIKNVSATFPSANAQVINGPNPKFIIKGIRPRQVPIGTKGQPYVRCLWKDRGSKLCGAFHLEAEDTWKHILKSHIGIAQNQDESWNFNLSRTGKMDCHWAGCLHFAPVGGTYSSYNLGMHIKVHLPDHSELAQHRSRFNQSVTQHDNLHIPGVDFPGEIPDDHNLKGTPAVHDYFLWLNTAVDERGEAAGLPLTSVLVLRNLARNIPKAVLALQSDMNGEEWRESSQVWMQRLFGPLRARLWHVMAHSRSLPSYVSDLINAIDKGIDG